MLLLAAACPLRSNDGFEAVHVGVTGKCACIHLENKSPEVQFAIHVLYCRSSHKRIQLKEGKEGGIPLKLLTSIGGSSSGAQSHLASLNSHTALIKTHLSSRQRFGSVQRTDFTSSNTVPSHGLHTVDGHLLAAQWDERLVCVFSSQIGSVFKDM